MGLNKEQISFFRENGYLLIPEALDPELCARARDSLWGSLPPGSDIRRDDPTSHVGPFPKKDMIDLDILRLDPPQENMWRDWSDELKSSSGEYGRA
jgi:hypothetical protein